MSAPDEAVLECEDCDAPDDFAFVPSNYPTIDGAVMECTKHNLPAPAWAYDQ